MIWDCISRNGRRLSQLKFYETGVHVNGEIYERLLLESCFKPKCYNTRLICLCMTMLLVKERVEFADCFGRKMFRYGNLIGQEAVRISTSIENEWFILERKVRQMLPKGQDDLVRKVSLALESVITP